MKDKWAIIDDIRSLNCDYIARTPSEGVTMMKEHFSEIGTLCMDHDLNSVVTGYDVLRTLGEINLIPNHVQMVTSNPVGRTNMANYLMGIGYETRDGLNFYKKC